MTEKGVTESFTDVLPCVSDSADVTITYNSVFHITELDNGSFHVSGPLTGTFTAVADGITYTGRFTGADGSRVTFSEVFHNNNHRNASRTLLRQPALSLN